MKRGRRSPGARSGRRRFLGALGATLAAPRLLQGRARPKRLPIAFSTLGCPSWDWKTVLGQASALGYAAIELRGLQGEMDLGKRPEFQGSRLRESQHDLDALELKVSDLGSSARFHDKEPAERAKAMDEGRRFVDLAHALGVPYVRVFGDKIWPDEPKDQSLARIAEGLGELGGHAAGSGVTVLIESHGDIVTSPLMKQVLEAAASPAVALLWDAHHTAVVGKEDPADTWAALGRYVRHTHLKDSRPEGDGQRRYVLTGTGDVPVRKTVQVLAAAGYKGYYCFEWEKVWHPEIEAPEVSFPHYAKTMAAYLEAAGVKSL